MLEAPGPCQVLTQPADTSGQRPARDLLCRLRLVCEAESELEGALPEPDLGTERDAPRLRALVLGGHHAVVVVEVDEEVRGVQVAGCPPQERPHHRHPGATPVGEERGRVGPEHVAVRHPVRRGLDEQAKVRHLGPKGHRQQQRIRLRVHDEVLVERVLGVLADGAEDRDPRLQPAHLVASLTGVVDRRRPLRGDQEAQSLEHRLIHRGEEDLGEVSLSDGEPDPTSVAGSGTEPLFPSGPPTDRGPGAPRRSHLPAQSENVDGPSSSGQLLNLFVTPGIARGGG